MAMEQTTLSSAIQAAFLLNIPAPTTTAPNDQITAIKNVSDALATAIIGCIESMTLTYTSGLVAPSGGGPVTGVLTSVVVS